jgi:hypothetical protein
MDTISNPEEVLNLNAGSLSVDDKGIYFLGQYTPYWIDHDARIRNENFTAFSGLILDIKESKPNGILTLASRLKSLINSGIPICIVPSSNPERSDSGMMRLAKLLTQYGPLDATSCLQRTEKIPKLATGGDRDIETHLRTVQVVNPNLIRDKHVLLLDDVTTTGNSLLACKQLLLDAGAADVTCLALSKTTR